MLHSCVYKAPAFPSCSSFFPHLFIFLQSFLLNFLCFHISFSFFLPSSYPSSCSFSFFLFLLLLPVPSPSSCSFSFFLFLLLLPALCPFSCTAIQLSCRPHLPSSWTSTHVPGPSPTDLARRRLPPPTFLAEPVYLPPGPSPTFLDLRLPSWTFAYLPGPSPTFLDLHPSTSSISAYLSGPPPTNFANLHPRRPRLPSSWTSTWPISFTYLFFLSFCSFLPCFFPCFFPYFFPCFLPCFSPCFSFCLFPLYAVDRRHTVDVISFVLSYVFQSHFYSPISCCPSSCYCTHLARSLLLSALVHFISPMFQHFLHFSYVHPGIGLGLYVAPGTSTQLCCGKPTSPKGES
jgi:hypothetical protein